MNNLIGSLNQCLPPAYSWVESIKITDQEGLTKDSWNLIPVQQLDQNIKLLVSGLGDFADQIKSALGKLNWNAAELTQRLVVEDIPILVVAVSSIKTNPIKVSRQVGMEAATSLLKSSVDALNIQNLDGGLTLEDVFEGICVGLDDRSAFKSKPTAPIVKTIQLPAAAVVSCENRRKIAKSLIFSKWLQDAPSNFLNPQQFADIASKFFETKAKVSILGREELEAKGMGAFLAVAAGATSDPKLVTIEFAGKDSSKTVALVGKGVTFDTGGINLKPSAGLEDMKYDMSGAAAVYGAAHYFSEEQPPVNVICAIGAVENMPSGEAIKPGDIVRSSSGKTVEILNTDAEGRLVLADVLTHTITNHKPDLVIDIATLTGAVLFGLGHSGAAFMTSDDNIASYIGRAGELRGESLWRLPLWPELEQEVASEIADIKNLPKPGVKAGTIMGGWFLHEFVKDHPCQWAHVDIAGTAWNCSSLGYHKTGGSGFGVRTLIAACENFAL